VRLRKIEDTPKKRTRKAPVKKADETSAKSVTPKTTTKSTRKAPSKKVEAAELRKPNLLPKHQKLQVKRLNGLGGDVRKTDLFFDQG